MNIDAVLNSNSYLKPPFFQILDPTHGIIYSYLDEKSASKIYIEYRIAASIWKSKILITNRLIDEFNNE